MKKRLLITITVILTLAMCIGVFAGCTENLKQKPIATETSAVVGSNGGMAVVYGNYLYFINGYAGQDSNNKFGEAIKGSIARVALKDGVPSGEAQIIVPKNIYGTDGNYGGIYIADDYIYYLTPSSKLDGDGNPKSTEGVLMRTKVNGTDSKELAAFENHSVVFKVVGSNLVYIVNNELHSIDLKSKKLKDSVVEENILSGYKMDDNYIYYNSYVDGDSSNYVMKAYSFATGEIKSIISGAVYGQEKVQHTFGLLSVIDEGSNVRIFFTKSVAGTEKGIFSLVTDKETFSYAAANEKQLTRNASGTENLNYSAFYKVGNYYFGFASKKLDVFDANGNFVKNGDEIVSVNVGNTITVFDIEETSDSAYLWYLDSNSVLRKIKIMAKEGENWVLVEGNEIKIFSGSTDSTYVKMEKIGSVLYYFNSKVSNNAYYYVIDGEKPAEGKEKILGLLTQEDIIAAF